MTPQSFDDAPRGIRSKRRFKVGNVEDWPNHSFVVTTQDGSLWLVEPSRALIVYWPAVAVDGQSRRLLATDWLAIGHPLTFLVLDDSGEEAELHGGEVTRIVAEAHSSEQQHE